MNHKTEGQKLTTEFALYQNETILCDMTFLQAALALCESHTLIEYTPAGSRQYRIIAKRKYYLAIDKLLEKSSVVKYVNSWREVK